MRNKVIKNVGRLYIHATFIIYYNTDNLNIIGMIMDSVHSADETFKFTVLGE